MTVIKKKIKLVESKNKYLPHKIRSHPFNFINLPLKVAFFFIFYWIVLVPVLYCVFLNYVAGFAAVTVPFFLVMLAGFLIIMGLFVYEWRRKRDPRKTEIYYIKYEAPDSLENLDVKKSLEEIEQADVTIVKKKKKSLVDIERPEEVPIRKKSREMIYLTDKKPNVENQRTIIIEENSIKHTVYLRESKQKAERPSSLLIEENYRPVSQNVNSRLSPRELFFLDMYEYANKAMRDVTAEFIKRERQGYVSSGPVSRVYSDSDSSSDTQVIETDVEQQYPKEKLYHGNEEYPKSVLYTRREHYSTREQYPTDEQYSVDDQQPEKSQSGIKYPVAPDHSSLLKVLEEFSDNKERKFGPRPRGQIENQQPEKRQSIIKDFVAPDRSSLLKELKEFSADKEGKFSPRSRIEVTEIKKEREYFIANVVPTESCVTEAFLFVDETKSDQKPKFVVVEVRESS